MFSTTTIPLSTSRPSPITNPNNTILLSVSPKADKITKDMNIDIGIANPTNNAFLSPRKKVKTVTTNIIPKIKLFIKSLTELIVYSD